MITVVIPAYNAHDTIERTILSIINQSIHDKIKVLIINDKSQNNYQNFVKKYKDLIDIDEIELLENSGPGIARRVGIEKTETNYLTFIDADDIFLDNMFFEGSIEHLEKDKKCIMISAGFLEQSHDKKLFNHTQDMTWVFGKIYRVENIRKKGITFSDLRANEDLEFNMKNRLTLKDDEYIHFLDDKSVYLWQYKEDSITRVNNVEYSYRGGLIGGIEAKARAYDFVGMTNEVIDEALNEVVHLYNGYISIVGDRYERTDWLEEFMEKARWFYKKYAKSAFDDLPKEKIAYMFNSRSMRNVKHILPMITFDEFMKLLNKQ